MCNEGIPKRKNIPELPKKEENWRMTYWKRRHQQEYEDELDDSKARCQFCLKLFPRMQILAHEQKCSHNRPIKLKHTPEQGDEAWDPKYHIQQGHKILSEF